MRCVRPLRGQRGPEGTIFGRGRYTGPGMGISVPCGQCIGCRLAKSREWGIRMMHEAQMHEENSFITLTYDEKHLPKSNSLQVKDVQDFMKRLRKALAPKKIRFFHCGEYGDQGERPHYHMALFGHEFPDQKLHTQNMRGERLFISAELDEFWGKGFCLIGALEFDSAQYIARYVTKKLTGPPGREKYGERKPPYATMSRRPGIGESWFRRFKRDLYPSDFCIINGAKVGVPRYYDDLLSRGDPEMLEEVKRRRRTNAAVHAKDTTPERLKDVETCMEARASLAGNRTPG